MNDKELLDLAAKAWMRNCLISGMSVDESVKEMLHGKEFFNPLIDDGDALRLVVRLDMMVDVRGAWIVVEAAGDSVYEDARHDTLAATRRAIVRAAAAIGAEL